MRYENRYLQLRNDGRWHYVRRVPGKYREFDNRAFIRKGLDTKSVDVARARRDLFVEADDLYWASLSSAAEGAGAESLNALQTSQAYRRYEAAKRRAMAKGFIYTPNADLLEYPDITELVSRIKTLPEKSLPQKREAEAVLGIVPKPSVLMSSAFEIYCNQIAVSELIGKSDAQKKSWHKVKLRAVNNFIALVGDLPMDGITREHAREFYNWWAGRLIPKGNQKALTSNSANRDLGNIRKLYRQYWEFEGDEMRENPFRNLSFAKHKLKDIPHFEDDWIRSRFLSPRIFKGLNAEAILLVYAMIETGCRPSELSNLIPENIVLDSDVPHLRIRPQNDRQLKSKASVREVPLVGVSLEAMKRAPNGFPNYMDRGNLLSASLMKAFRSRELFPGKDHRIYSFRHSFEKRMLEAGLDYGLRCLLMGHQNSRPSYGDGGSMTYRRDELLKIVHPVPKQFEIDLAAVI